MGDGVRTIDCSKCTTREINAFLKECASRSPEAEVVLVNPDSRHNLGVGIVTPLTMRFDGHVGYYCSGLCDGVEVEIDGDAGWGVAENLMGGSVLLKGSAGSAAAASMRGGSVVIEGSAGARCGIAMKGGSLVVHGDVGIMTGFMMQKGVMVIGGSAGEGLGDSLYEGVIYIRGAALSLGSDAVEKEMSKEDVSRLTGLLAASKLDASPRDFKKIASGKKLYNFSTKEKEIWSHAL
jgi:glutamate synthase domain-containing protein 3